ncbi:MAG: zinc dependent phospholipase C family protein [Treponema sp.]|nr:zinc dependent phospholipase C family protein [Treponema sp.]
MKRNGMGLKRFPFILGNLAPDIYFSFLFRRHEYGCSALSVRKSILRLYEGCFDPCSAPFAYFMGVASHYVCDYFCYSHSPSFRGNLWDHIKYEWLQRMPAPEKVIFYEQEGQAMGFRRLMDTLDEYIRNHNRVLARGSAAPQTDLSMGTAVAGWLAEAVFYSAEQLSLPAAVSLVIAD